MTAKSSRIVNYGRALALTVVAGLALSTAATAQIQSTSPYPLVGSSAGMLSHSSDNSGAAAVGHTGSVTEDLAKLRLAPGFLIQVQILDGPDFSGSYRVDEAGNLTLPYAGAIRLAGKTMTEAQAAIAERLISAELFRKPQVQVTVLEYTTPMVTILGEVNTPGKFPLLAEHKFVDVISLAGGLTPSASNQIEIERKDESGVQVIKLDYGRGSSPATVESVIVRPGDVIHVPRAGIVYVLGAVNRPGGYLMQEDGKLNAPQALAMAWGTAKEAYMHGIHILRRDEKGNMMRIPVEIPSTMKAKREPEMLRAGDVLYVPPSKFKTVLMDSTSMLNAMGSAAIYKTY